jgi:hypothetical protein
MNMSGRGNAEICEVRHLPGSNHTHIAPTGAATLQFAFSTVVCIPVGVVTFIPTRRATFCHLSSEI